MLKIYNLNFKRLDIKFCFGVYNGSLLFMIQS